MQAINFPQTWKLFQSYLTFVRSVVFSLFRLPQLKCTQFLSIFYFTPLHPCSIYIKFIDCLVVIYEPAPKKSEIIVIRFRGPFSHIKKREQNELNVWMHSHRRKIQTENGVHIDYHYTTCKLLFNAIWGVCVRAAFLLFLFCSRFLVYHFALFYYYCILLCFALLCARCSIFLFIYLFWQLLVSLLLLRLRLLLLFLSKLMSWHLSGIVCCWSSWKCVSVFVYVCVCACVCLRCCIVQFTRIDDEWELVCAFSSPPPPPPLSMSSLSSSLYVAYGSYTFIIKW